MAEFPTVSELLANPVVLMGLRSAYLQSDVGGARPLEQGGFLLLDLESPAFLVAHLPASSADSLEYPLCTDGRFQNREIVGTFHTHPNVGPGWRQEPSPQDIQLSVEYPETMGPHQFVLARDATYHIDNEGRVTNLGSTTEILGLPSQETS